MDEDAGDGIAHVGPEQLPAAPVAVDEPGVRGARRPDEGFGATRKNVGAASLMDPDTRSIGASHQMPGEIRCRA
jgi:hypothetical protein